RLLQNATPLELVDQLPELLVEIRDAIVVCVDGELHALGRKSRLVQLPPMVNQKALIIVSGLDAKTMKPSGRQLIGIMRIEVVQEREKRALRRRATRQPVEELAIDLRRPPTIAGQRPPDPFEPRQQP